ncbi:TPA: YodC family protein [Klebsiella pneumoniae]|uniref:YodC family protein n=1 Tax=Klebsiella pneumoniae TaxID=573 RepID=UPI0018C56091|nr:YodC family protein [Klebsiella pneumoniae]ELA0474883.1 YodC family protein [Klebsiella pneumoniae]MBG2411322.1 YodC family protein [Klebsiella pneumoniae]MCY3494577.1 YodC family protein [Klebsiella pneumoniae]HBS4090582.1 YodC family protein [Klebsiella pneumoniae]HED3582338.1 YodC family protein [Klebsiella pneumoniae]
MSDDFKTGDIVKLKSGGPDMTIKLFAATQGNSFLCQWFAGKKLEQGYFKPESLERASPKP